MRKSHSGLINRMLAGALPTPATIFLTLTPIKRQDGSMDIIINRVAVWQPQISDGLVMRKHSIGTIYKRKDSEIYERSTAPIFRFAKNYEKDGQKFCLFCRVFVNEPAVIENELDKIAEKLDDSYIRRIKVIVANNPMDFEYTDYYVLEDAATVTVEESE